MLPFAVHLRIFELTRAGGPNEADYEFAQTFGSRLAEKGDILLYGGGKKGEPADLFNELARAVAVLSFCPGGLDLLGEHYEAKK